MDFYYRHLGNGRCEVVCARCSQLVGVAEDVDAVRGVEVNRRFPSVGNVGVEAVRALEENHRCADGAGERVIETSRAAHQPANQQRGRGWLGSAALLLAAVLFLYGLPTLIEFIALRTWSPWIAVVFPGNLAGCLCLMLAFRKVGLGIALYLALLAGQALLYGLQIADAQTIFWISDAVPTMIVAGMILSRRAMTMPTLKML